MQARNEFAPAVLLMRRDHELAYQAKEIASKQAAPPMAPADPCALEDGELMCTCNPALMLTLNRPK